MQSFLQPVDPADFAPVDAAYLMGRAGFGCTWQEAEALSKQGLENVVAALVTRDLNQTTSAPPAFAALPEITDEAFRKQMEPLSQQERNEARNLRRKQALDGINSLKSWWLDRMLNAPNPLIEKMALFWHSHFASSFNDKIEQVFPMWQQNEFFRSNALSPFPVLMQGIIRDPAMLVWLDNASNHKGHPNENFARELMELFSTGVNQYTEEDVQESARSLTGFGVNRETWEFTFNEQAHDEESKTFMEVTGNLSGDEITGIICDQKATADFITRKLLEYFVYENPEPELLEEASTLFRKYSLGVRAFLATLFKSRIFFANETRGRIVKDPVTLALGAVKTMQVKLPNDDVLIDALRVMGQDLFFPPDVNGWPGGMTWINSNTLLVRYNFANFLLYGVSPDSFKVFNREDQKSASMRRDFVQQQRSPKAVEWDPRQQLEDSGLLRTLTSAERIVTHYLREFLQRSASPDTTASLIQFCKTDASGGRGTLNVNDENFNERIKGLVHLIMSSPEYQLC